MRIGIGSDHAGFDLKEEIKGLLEELGHEYEDVGCFDKGSVDYPDIAYTVAKGVMSGEYDLGILICGTGVGMSIVANKVKGIRAALCLDPFTARKAREHNDANVLCLGGWLLGSRLAREVARAFLEAEFQGGRHERRVGKIKAIEDEEFGTLKKKG